MADDLRRLTELLQGRRMVALVGAGCSTESGIPDYRGPETARRARNPIRWNAFAGDAAVRRRYWARSLVGFPRVRSARPNPAHRALAELERRGDLVGVITQNVDGLHHAAGSRQVVELHGALRRVRCQGCERVASREAFQRRLEDRNPEWVGRTGSMAPDGDAEVDDTAGFVVPRCHRCSGELRPDVVFFGENVPRPVVERAYGLVDQAEALLVVGSSLVVFSGYRFVKRAASSGMPVGIVNLGETRGDALAQVRVDGRAGEVLPALALALS